MAAQNFKEEDWGDGDTFRGRNWAKNFQAWNRGVDIYYMATGADYLINQLIK